MRKKQLDAICEALNEKYESLRPDPNALLAALKLKGIEKHIAWQYWDEQEGDGGEFYIVQRKQKKGKRIKGCPFRVRDIDPDIPFRRPYSALFYKFLTAVPHSDQGVKIVWGNGKSKGKKGKHNV